jgi:hypothetical protein
MNRLVTDTDRQILLETKIGNLFSKFCVQLNFDESKKRNQFSHTFQNAFESIFKVVQDGEFFINWNSMFRQLEKMNDSYWNFYNEHKQESFIFRWTYEQMIEHCLDDIYYRNVINVTNEESSSSSEEKEEEEICLSTLLKSKAECLFLSFVTFIYQKDPRQLMTLLMEMSKTYKDSLDYMEERKKFSSPL